jgi:uncharacterized caspase-like protein
MNLPGFPRRSFGSGLRLFCLAAAMLLACQPARAEKRVALVLGNSAYQNVTPLPNPVNDGAMIANMLEGAGFDIVDSRHDLTAADTRRVLRDFADRARNADIAVIYYAGHGMEVDGRNYLIPVDAKLERDTDVYDEAVSLDRILLAVEPATQLRLVILDACRDNPFAKTMKRTIASRSIGSGLAKVEPTSPNTLIAYSAKAGSTALDGAGKNGPFAIALRRHLTTPGLDVRRAFGYVRDDVLKDTGNRQEPFVYGSLGGDDVALVPVKSAPTAAAPLASAGNPRVEVRRDYELALQVGNKDAMNAFLAQHPDGFYANLARIELAKMAAEEARVAEAGKARPAEPERSRPAAEAAQNAPSLRGSGVDAKPAEQARLATDQAAIDAAAQKLAAAEISAAGASHDGKPAAAAGPSTAAKPQGKAPATNLAALTPAPSPAEIAKSVQIELRRVGCLSGPADGQWNAASQRSLTLFNRHAGTRLDVKLASLDTLDAIKLKPGRVCPLVCEHGFRADGDRCSRIVCAEGSFLNDDDVCEKRRGKPPIARRDRGDRPERDQGRLLERPEPELAAPRPRPSREGSGQGSAQIVCDTIGCRPVQRGCHLEFRTTAQGGPVEGGGGNVQICN